MQLIRFKTYSPNKEEKERAAKFLIEYAKSMGLDGEIVYSENDTPNVLINPEKNADIVVVTHFDVVPPGEGWEFNPFEPFIKDGKLFGRGAADDKGSVIASIDALASSNPSKKVTLAIAGGEETQESEKFFEGLKGKVVFVVDVGPYFSIGCSGFLGIWVRVKGRQTHSAYPFLERNALYDAGRVLVFLKGISKAFEEEFVSSYVYTSYPKGVPVRVNPTKIEVKPNVINIIPGEVDIYVNARTVPEYPNHFVFEKFKEMVEEFAREEGISLEVFKDKLEMEPWVSSGEEVEKYYQMLKPIFGEGKYLELGGTDGYHFYKRGMQVIQFGPMRDENNIHSPNEWVYIEDLEKVERALKVIFQDG